MLSKYLGLSRSAGETEDYYGEVITYSESQPEKTITERVKLNLQKRKNRHQNQHFKFKQTINHTSKTISTNKSWKLDKKTYLLHQQHKITKTLQ